MTLYIYIYTRFCAVGGDIPALSADLMEESLCRLEQEDMVLGPAQDGGYYLVGLNKHAQANLGGIVTLFQL